jgi:hypothetical protein
MAPHRCQYCGKAFQTRRAANHHTSLAKSCYNEWRKDLVRNKDPSPKRQKKNSSTEMPVGEQWEDAGIADDFVLPSPPRRASVEEEVEDEAGNTYPTSKAERFIEAYPGDAGKGLRKSKTRFEVWLENQRGEEKIAWDPFASEQEWALTMWVMKNVGQKSTDEFLKLQIVSKLSVPV